MPKRGHGFNPHLTPLARRAIHGHGCAERSRGVEAAGPAHHPYGVGEPAGSGRAGRGDDRLVLLKELVRSIEQPQKWLVISVPYLGKVAAEVVLRAREELEEVRRGYANNRGYLLEELPKIGISDFHRADGAFYMYAGLSRFTNDSAAFCKRMLEEAGVAATAGLDYDRERRHRRDAAVVCRLAR